MSPDPAEPVPAGRRIRVVVVDDTPAVRLLLRSLLDLDDRFELVGEATDGIEAVALAAEVVPDLVVLDRDMPRLDGVAAIPGIRAAAPRCAVVLFTAAADAGTYQAATAAGAVDVFEKASLGPELVDALGEALLGHLADLRATLEVRIGPVPSEVARLWIGSTRRLLAAIKARPDVVDPRVDPAVLDVFDRFLTTWAGVADAGGDFFWQARAVPDEVTSVIEQWAAIDRMTDDQLVELGASWSPPEARPFFEALTTGVLEALQAHAATSGLAAELEVQWSAGPDGAQGPMSPT